MIRCYQGQRVVSQTGLRGFPAPLWHCHPLAFRLCSALLSPPLGTTGSAQPSSTCHWDWPLTCLGRTRHPRPHPPSCLWDQSGQPHPWGFPDPSQGMWPGILSSHQRGREGATWNQMDLTPCGETIEQSEIKDGRELDRFLPLPPSTDHSGTYTCLACPETSHVCS